MSGPPILVLMKKWKRLKGALKEWNKIVFCSVEWTVQQAQEQYDAALKISNEGMGRIEALEELNTKDGVLNSAVLVGVGSSNRNSKTLGFMKEKGTPS